MKNPEKADTLHHLGIASPEFLAANTIAVITYGTDPNSRDDRGRAVVPIRDNIADLTRTPEIDGAIILASQIGVLNAIFSRYSQLSMSLLERGKPEWESALHLALRAQNEARRSIVSLNLLRHPKQAAVFIKKQQNNLVVDGGKNAQMDVGSQAAAIGANQNLEALGGFDGGKVR